MSVSINTTSRRKVRTAAALRWLDSQLQRAQDAGDQTTTIKVSETGRLAAEDVADFFSRNKFEAHINADSNAVSVVPRRPTKKETAS
jgi:hypothetical protein